MKNLKSGEGAFHHIAEHLDKVPAFFIHLKQFCLTKFDSLFSYITGGGMITYVSLTELKTWLEILGLFLGIVLVIGRIRYDRRKYKEDFENK